MASRVDSIQTQTQAPSTLSPINPKPKSQVVKPQGSSTKRSKTQFKETTGGEFGVYNRASIRLL